jgi:hypothetical protein
MTRDGRNRNVRCGVRNVNKQTFVHEHCQRQLSTQVSGQRPVQMIPRADAHGGVSSEALRPRRSFQGASPSLECRHLLKCALQLLRCLLQ